MALFASIIMLGATAQTHLPSPSPPYKPLPAFPYNYNNFGQPLWFPSPFYFSPASALVPAFIPFDNSSRRLQFKPYAGVSAGFAFLNGGMSWLSAPAGIFVVRPLNNNLVAFGNLSVAPTVFSMSRFYSSPAAVSPFSYGPYGLSTRMEGGLLYTNDARTFSISGSVSVERDNYPAYPPVRQYSPVH